MAKYAPSLNGRQGVKEVGEPPIDNRPKLKIIKAPAFGRSSFVVLSPRVYRYHLHHDGARTRACTGEPATCAYCGMGLSLRWAGYLAVWDTHTNLVHLLELTHGAYTHCPQLAELAGQLRGVGIEVWRLKKNPKGPVSCRPTKAVISRPLPDEPHVHHALCRIWSVPLVRESDGEGGEP